MTPEEKLSRIEAELIQQTGCSADEIVALYQSPIPKPVVNARMGAAHRARFAAEDERDRLREINTKLSAALETINRWCGKGDVNIQPLLLPIQEQARAALAVLAQEDQGK
jgi:hypothetical protein